MPAGMQTFGPNGAIRLDLTDRLTRIISVISVAASASGNIQLPEGTAWYMVCPANAGTAGTGYYVPNISVNSSNVLSYSPSTTRGNAVDCTLIVGVY